jgi:RND superfamily putative drug exporter
MMVITSEEPMSANTMTFINELRNAFHGENGYDTQYSAIWSASYVTGTAALMNDVSVEVEDQFGMIRIVVIVLLIVLLFFILGSYLTPIRAILTIMLSVIVTVALTRFVFDELMSTPVMFLIPIVLFVVLLGLGMDYEIFLTTKIRENKIKGMDNHEAISNAIREAGPIISLCALIMGGTFLTMLLAGSSMLQEFGFALGVGILLDGLVMVGFFSPSMMHLMGNWSWKGPAFLTRRHGLNPDGTNMVPSEPEEQA